MSIWRALIIGLGSLFSGAGLAAFIIIGRWTWYLGKLEKEQRNNGSDS